MAKQVLNDAYVSIAANDLSAYAESVELEESVDLQEATVMGNTARARVAGLKDWSVTVNFRQDFADNLLDEILAPLFGTAVAIEIRPDTDAVGPANPKYTGTGILESYAPISGSVGQTLNTKVVIRCSNGTALARATS